MTVPNQRDPDMVQTVKGLRQDLDAHRQTLISKWGRVPILTADPTSPPDGSIWSRSDTGELRYQSAGGTIALPTGRRSQFDNGAIQVLQRTGIAVGVMPATTSYTNMPDRWQWVTAGSGTWTGGPVNVGPADSGLTNSIVMQLTGAGIPAPAATDIWGIRQNIEGQNLQNLLYGTASARPATISFWVLAHGWSGPCRIYIGNGASTRFVTGSYTINNQDVWEYKTVTIPGDQVAAIANDANAGLVITWGLGAGSNYTAGALPIAWTASSAGVLNGQTNMAATTNNFIRLTGLQIEVGAVATPFEFVTYSDDLRRCQRYALSIFPGGAAQPFGYGQCFGATDGIIGIPLPTPMRAGAPTLALSALGDFVVWGANSVGVALTNLVFYAYSLPSSLYLVRLTTAAGLVAGNATALVTNNANSRLTISSDL